LPPENIIEAAKAGYADDAHVAFHMDLIKAGKSNAGFYIDGGLCCFSTTLLTAPRCASRRGRR
jgi:hypothetical protein